jgi:hypothetical protein
MHLATTSDQPDQANPPKASPVRAALLVVMAIVTAATLTAAKILDHPNETRRALQPRGLRRGGNLDAQRDEQGNVITDNLAWIVFGVLAIVVIGGAISGLGTAVINWATTKLGV